MKTKIFNKITTYLNYSLSREEQEILAKSNKILSELFETIEECTDNNMNDFDELIKYYNEYNIVEDKKKINIEDFRCVKNITDQSSPVH